MVGHRLVQGREAEARREGRKEGSTKAARQTDPL